MDDLLEEAQADEPDWGAAIERDARARSDLESRVFDALFPGTGGNLESHARRELEAAGLFKPNSDYEGMLADAVMALVRVFASQGHSGFSAHQTIELFRQVAAFKCLTALTDKPDEWMEVDGNGLLQSRRQSSCFSEDAGRSYYDIDERDIGGRVYHLTEPYK